MSPHPRSGAHTIIDFPTFSIVFDYNLLQMWTKFLNQVNVPNKIVHTQKYNVKFKHQ